MGKLSYDPQSWQRKIASNNILQYMRQNSEFQLGKLVSFISLQNNKTNIQDMSLAGLLQFVKEENTDKLLTLWGIYNKTKDDIATADWYIRRVFLQAKNTEVAKTCIPKQYWAYLQGILFTGDSGIDILDEYCYSLLEQATMNNVLLGIRGNTN